MPIFDSLAISPANRAIIIINFTPEPGAPTVRGHTPSLQAIAGRTIARICARLSKKEVVMDPIWALFVDFDERPSTGKLANPTIQPEAHMSILDRSFRVSIERLNEVLRRLVSRRSRSKSFEPVG